MDNNIDETKKSGYNVYKNHLCINHLQVSNVIATSKIFCNNNMEVMITTSKTDWDAVINKHLYFPRIREVIFNDPATIVFWEDGTKTVVKANDEIFDPEKGLAMAISKKAFGNKGQYFDHIKKWTKAYDETL